MYKHTLKELPKNTKEITVTVQSNELEKEKEKVFKQLLSNLAVAGFRKGKVPRKIGAKHIDKTLVYERALGNLLDRIYTELVKKESLKPIVQPKIEVLKIKEGEDKKIKITVAEKPKIDLKDYKKKVAELRSKNKKDSIWVPGKKMEKEDNKGEEQSKTKWLNKVLNLLLEETECEISDMIIEKELNNRLSKLVDDLQKMGLSTEAYLKSKKMTLDQLKSRYKKEIIDIYKLEFILMEVADREKIVVDKKDLEKVLKDMKTEKEKKVALANSYYYASVIRKQKTLDFLMSL